MHSKILPVLLLALVAACRQAPPAPAEAPSASSPPPAGGAPIAAVAPAGAPVSAPVPAPVPGPAAGGSEVLRVDSNCPENRRIDTRDASLPEGVVTLAFRAAMRGDETGFEAFWRLFVPGKQRESVREDLWTRLVRFVPKYAESSTDATWTLCRTVPMGQGRVKLFVKSNDPAKSDPPIVLEQVDGMWRIDVLTP